MDSYPFTEREVIGNTPPSPAPLLKIPRVLPRYGMNFDKNDLYSSKTAIKI
jgi:hypothetical protein